MSDASKGWRADCFRTSMSRFDEAYAKAQASTHPQDWMDAALLAQQFRNVAYAVLTGEAPRQSNPLPFNLDQRAQAAVLADLPASVAQEAGEFYENADGGRRGKMLKREAMAVAWAQVLRPYLIGLRDHYARQARPAPCDEPPSGRDRNGLGGDSPAGAVAEGQAPGLDHSRPTAPGTEQGEGIKPHP